MSPRPAGFTADADQSCVRVRGSGSGRMSIRRYASCALPFEELRASPSESG